MGALKLTFCPGDALQLVKEHQPLVWECKLYTYNSELLHIVDAKNVSLTKALQHLVNKYSNMASKIYALASYQHIMSETIKEYNNVTTSIKKYTAQLLAIQTPGQVPIISQSELDTLMQFYRDQIKSLETRKTQLLAYPEVVNNIEVTAEIVSANQT